MINHKQLCPTWIKFLERVTNNDSELSAFLQRSVGYSLSGVTSEQCLFFLHGQGANGKSTFINTIKKLMNDYARQASPDTFMVKDRSGGATPELARLRGARLVVTTEVEDGQRFAESLIKQITGQDLIAVRHLYKEPFEYLPQFKVWIAANHKPDIRGQDAAIWRRIHLIPFTVTIPEGERDKTLSSKLELELPGILNWATDGFQMWQEFGLLPPKEVTAATEEYRNDMDYIAQWIADKCEVSPNSGSSAAELYFSYKKWCEATRATLLTQNRLGRELSRRGFIKTAQPARGWRGIAVRTRIGDVAGR
jgi:putative DNA primase/helicase